MSPSTPFTLPSPSGTPLHGLVDVPEGAPVLRPMVVVCHGFKGFMEWGFYPPLVELFAARGFVTVRFNVSGSGMAPGGDSVSDPEGFRANTHSRERDDLLAVLEHLPRIAPGWIDERRIGLLGHSRGGANAVLAAASEPWRERIKALVTWAAISRVDRYSDEQKEAWRRDGELPVVNARTGQRLALGPGFLEDLETHREELDLDRAAAAVRAPWLLIHGDKDESVPTVEVDRLAGHATGVHEVVRIPGGDHTFGARHPFVGPTPQLIQTLNATQTWFRRYL
jgi:dipeptidyl aminopeptidase/acylaminoacyl peptidase